MLNESEQKYIKDVLNFVSWKRAHECIERELSDHIEDFREARISEGADAETASAEALKEMGDCALVGSSMNKVYRPRFSKPMLIAFAVILLCGILIRIFTDSYDNNTTSYLLSLFLGAAVFFTVRRFTDLKWLFEKTWWIVGGYAIVLVASTVCPPLYAFERLNDFIWEPLLANWYIYVSLFQPVVLALILWKLKNKGVPGLIILGLLSVLLIYPLLLAPKFAVAAMLAAADAAITAYAIIKGWLGKRRWLLLCISILLLAGAAAVLICVFGSYRLYRMINLYPLSITTESYKTHCIREILSQSSLFGGIDPAGISAKTGDFLYQTAYVQTSYLLVYLASHVGLWIYPAVILLTAGFSFFAVRWCLRQSSMFSRLISLSIISVLIVQWVLYIAVNLGVFNGFTLPLPFLSHGNVSFVVNMALAGLLFCVSGTGWLYSDEPRRAKALKDGIPSAAE